MPISYIQYLYRYYRSFKAILQDKGYPCFPFHPSSKIDAYHHPNHVIALIASEQNCGGFRFDETYPTLGSYYRDKLEHVHQ